MAGEAYQRFLDGMVMNFDKWHDGIGYDLKALQQLDPEERSSIEALLIKKLEEAGDWRDVEALFALGSATARAAVDQARYHKKTKVRNHALRIALDSRHSNDATQKEIDELEQQVIQAIKRGDFDIAQRMPTLPIKKALLDLVKEGRREVPANAAALLMYLCGQAPEPFDWDQRPFFLRCGSDDPTERRQAWEELRTRTGV